MSGPGFLALIGSGEATPVGGQVFESVLSRCCHASAMIRILETPAGFELNSAQVAGRIQSFLTTRLSNYRPDLGLVAARKKGGPFSSDDPGLAEEVLAADLLFMGPGSPSYAVRQLKGSQVWQAMRAAHFLGAPLVLASAAVVAVGRMALPVYEIYKVGEDPYWKEGLDLLGGLGLNLVFMPHWNNSDGGEELDTSRCFMGVDRFQSLAARLDKGTRVLGIDENTALMVDFEAQTCQVSGLGQVHLLEGGGERTFAKGQSFALGLLGSYREVDWPADLDPSWRERARAVQEARRASEEQFAEIPAQVLALVERRQEARAAKEWKEADVLRDQILELGWSVTDTREGPDLKKL